MSKRRGKFFFFVYFRSTKKCWEISKKKQKNCVYFLCLATEVNVARSRLKGALQDIEGNQNDDDDLDLNKPSRGRPPKRIKKELSPQPQQTVQHSFIMKLFDRSVDLGKYANNSSLYPICRAWLLDQPRSNLLVKYGQTNY